MRFGCFVLLMAGPVLVVAIPAQAQSAPALGSIRPLQFESWSVESTLGASRGLTVGRLVVGSRKRTRQALLGGVIGAAAGVVLCTAFSTLIDDSEDGGLSFCPLDTNLLIGGAGFVLGAAIGWVI